LPFGQNIFLTYHHVLFDDDHLVGHIVDSETETHKMSLHHTSRGFMMDSSSREEMYEMFQTGQCPFDPQ
jgi:hypothetical protein